MWVAWQPLGLNQVILSGWIAEGQLARRLRRTGDIGRVIVWWRRGKRSGGTWAASSRFPSAIRLVYGGPPPQRDELAPG